MASSVKPRSGYLPGLDGLRAFAILGVLMTHDLPWSIAGHSNEKWKGYGGWGVNLFFAISGVLICWRLLEDEAKLGRTRIKSFYIRRLFRIQPAAFAYLGVVAVLFLTHAIPINWQFWWGAVLSYANFLISAATPPGAGAFLGHFWTLSVEEHFYILISLCFLIPKRYRITLVAVLLVLFEVGQTIAEKRGLYVPAVSERRSYWVLQFLIFPALLTLVVRTSRIRALVGEYGKPWIASVILLSLMLLNCCRRSAHFFYQPRQHYSLVSFFSYNMDLLFYGFAVWIIAIMLHPRSLTTRFLEAPVLRFFGRLSYSIYLWHILFFIPLYLPDQINAKIMLVLSERPWKYILTLAAALISYYFIEKPMIRLGHRLAPPATAGHQDLNVETGSSHPVFPAPVVADISR